MHRCALEEGARGWLSDLPCSGDKSLCCSALRTEAVGHAGGRQRSGAWGEDGAPEPHSPPAVFQTSTSAAATPGASAATSARTRPAPTSVAAPPASGSRPTAGPVRVSGRWQGSLLGTDPRSFPRRMSNDVGGGRACERLRVRDGGSPVSPGSSGARRHLPVLAAEGAAWDHG